MKAADVLVGAYERIRGQVHRAADGLDRAALTYRPEPGANSIAWLVWHLTRVQDSHLSEVAGHDQVWVASEWAAALGMKADAAVVGKDDGPIDVAALAPDDAVALLGYHDAVADRSIAYLAGITAAELDRIIDPRYEPPVSVGVRLVSVLNDNLQHAGQARYLRGIIERIL